MTKEQIERLKQEIEKRKMRQWTEAEEKDLKQAIEIGATPSEIYKLKILPNKTQRQIFNKCAFIKGQSNE